MPTPHEFLETLAIVLGVAAFATVIFQRLRQPVVLGYIVAGLLVGPHVPIPIHAHPATVNVLSELGVILLMFAIGLELTFEKLWRVAPTAGVIGVIQVAFMMGAGFAVGRGFGWTQQESIFAGGAIAISSTTIIAKVFADLKVAPQLRELVYGVLIVEDILAILLLATMTTISSGAGLDAVTLAVTTAKLVGFLVGMVVIGLLLIPRLMRWVVGLGRPETTLVASVGVCFVLSCACAIFHYSVALGAFVAGVLVSESGRGHDVEHLLMPVRDMFAAIFFVSVGMLIDPVLVLENWLPVVVLSLVVVVGKIASVSVGAVVTGSGLRRSIQSGVSLAQIGEFSFIIAALGLSLGAARPFLFPVAVAVSAVTTLTTPALIRRSERLAIAIEKWLPRRLTAFVAVYSEWVDRARVAPRSRAEGARLRRLVILLFVDVALVELLLLGSALLHERVESAMVVRFGLVVSTTQMVFAAVAASVALPFVVGVVRLTRAIGLVIGGGADSPSPAGRRIAVAVQLGLLAAFGVASVVIVEPFVPLGVQLFLATALFTALVIAFWRNAKQLDVDVRAGAATVLAVLNARLHASTDADHRPSAVDVLAAETAAAEDASTLLPGLGQPALVPIDQGSIAIGRTVEDLDVRSRTGATILGVLRGGNVIVPEGTERLSDGDIVVLVGDTRSLQNAQTCLTTGSGGKVDAA